MGGDEALASPRCWLTSPTLPGSRDHQANARAPTRLMTVHSAKGLEFNVVFVRAGRGLFPHEHQISRPTAWKKSAG